jgi:hypothetical protein
MEEAVGQERDEETISYYRKVLAGLEPSAYI